MKIIAIGGGEIGRPGYQIETESIDKEIILLANKKSPKVLFLPTASGDNASYYETFQKYYGQKLRCKTDVLYLINNNFSIKEIKEKILASDIIYVGGGDTQEMLKVWNNLGINKILKDAGKKDIILSGLSAGSYCWFEKSISSTKEVVYDGIGLISGLSIVCHYPLNNKDKKIVWKNVIKVNIPVIALENCTAFEFVDDKYKIIASNENAKAYRLFCKNGKIVEEKLPIDNTFRSIKDLKKC